MDQIPNKENGRAVFSAGELLTSFSNVKSNWKLDADKWSRGSENK